MQCPKCGGSVSDRNAVECSSCGVILAKASAARISLVAVNPEDGSADRDLAQQDSVTGDPTVYVIAHGSPRGPIVGYAPPDQYYEALNHSIGD